MGNYASRTQNNLKGPEEFNAPNVPGELTGSPYEAPNRNPTGPTGISDPTRGGRGGITSTDPIRNPTGPNPAQPVKPGFTPRNPIAGGSMGGFVGSPVIMSEQAKASEAAFNRGDPRVRNAAKLVVNEPTPAAAPTPAGPTPQQIAQQQAAAAAQQQAAQQAAAIAAQQAAFWANRNAWKAMNGE
jgi:hypothetical protein